MTNNYKSITTKIVLGRKKQDCLNPKERMSAALL